jgi:hypothetical protein
MMLLRVPEVTGGYVTLVLLLLKTIHWTLSARFS